MTAREPNQARTTEVDGIRVTRRGGQLTFYACALWWLLLRRRRLDVVLDADCGIPVFSPLVLSRRRTAIVLLVHHVHLDQFGIHLGGFMAGVGRVLERRVMPWLYRGSLTVAVSTSTRNEMVEQLGWTGPVQVIHNGNTPRSLPRTAAPADRLVMVGRLAAHKRIDQVIRAVSRLRAARPGIRLDVVGRGPELESLLVLVRDMGLNDQVTLHGFLKEAEKVTLLAQSRLHITASDVEGWGQVVIEAASLGVPTIARDVPGLRDSIRDGETGWLLEELDQDPATLPARLAAGIDEALTTLDVPEQREELRIACVAWAARFSWEAMRESAVGVVVQAIENRN